MNLVKINIAPDKYVSTFKDAEDNIVKEEITEAKYSEPQVKEDLTWVSSSRKIAFDTPTGELSDSQYATQENGFHWVKIPEYEVIKINPEFIKDNILSQDGVKEIEIQSVRE